MNKRIYGLALVAVFSLMIAFNCIVGSAVKNSAQASGNNGTTDTANFNKAVSAINPRVPTATGDSPVIGFLKFAGVPGESTAPAHPGEIEILSFQQGITNTPGQFGGGGAGAGKAVVDEIKFQHGIDSSSVKLMALVANGKHIPSVKFTFQRNNQDFYIVTLTDVVVSHVKQVLGVNASETNQAGMVEEVGLTFKKIEWSYFPPGQPGAPIDGSFDLLTNTTKG